MLNGNNSPVTITHLESNSNSISTRSNHYMIIIHQVLNLEHALPPDEIGMPSVGARPSIEFDRWLVDAAHQDYRDPLFPLWTRIC